MAVDMRFLSSVPTVCDVQMHRQSLPRARRVLTSQYLNVAFGAVLFLLLNGLSVQAELDGVDEIQVPSDQPISLFEERVIEPEMHILYLSFLAPALGGDYGITYDRADVDMKALCETLGIDLAGQLIVEGIFIDEVVIRLMERPIPYGEVDPEAAQFLNAYDISGGNCEWV